MHGWRELMVGLSPDPSPEVTLRIQTGGVARSNHHTFSRLSHTPKNMTTTTCLRAVQTLCNLLPTSAKAGEKRKLPGKSHWLKPLAILCLMWGTSGGAQYGKFYYEVFANRATITDSSDWNNESVVIPATLNGYPVTSIGRSAFHYRIHGEVSVTIPNSVTSIGQSAFSLCSMTSVVIPGSVASIGDSAFAECGHLTSVTIPASVTSIGASAFAHSGLTSVTIPNTVTSIGRSAFLGCGGLATIFVDAGNSYYASDDGVLFDKMKTTLLEFPALKSGAYAIPIGVTGMQALAFYGCRNLTSVTIPTGVTSIENSTFEGCYNLATVSIPDGVTYITSNAFRYCGALSSVTIPNSVANIGDSAFASCVALTSVIIPSGVAWINDNAFGGCSGLTRAYFMGDAPYMNGPNAFISTAGNFAVYYLNGATGFTTPTWKGYSAFPGLAPQFSSPTPPATGKIGIPYYHTCAATGTPQADFAVTSGALPDGLSLSIAGSFSGTPNKNGIFTGTITATNGIPPDTTQDFVIDTNEYRTLAAGGSNGTVTGEGMCVLNSAATLTATPAPGYLFTGWTGDATGTANPLSVLMDADKAIGATFTPDTNDDDGDGLTNFQEIVEFGTNPTLPDTDGDTVKDGKDAFPLDPAETLDTDRDGTGDNADTDDDGDGYSDTDELTIHHTNPKRADSDGDELTDPAEIETHHTNPNIADTDNDGLSDGEEFTTYHTNPLIGDTDGDGFLDGYEVLTGKLPLDPLDKPALVAEARTAIEFTFPAAVGKTYRIEASTDLAAWAIVESGIAGAGGEIQRFYSTRGQPKRYFRVEEGEL
jgi:uncharacterized repeat protein (TIGR02543 family)